MKPKKVLISVLALLLTGVILANPRAAMEAVRESLILCGDIIIPSLYPFFVCSGLLIYSGFAGVVARIMSPVMKPLFAVNGSGAAAFVLGIISGYPLGASTACSLYESGYISKYEAERLLGFCNNSGPLFILGAVGVSLFGNMKIGWIIYISHIAAAFIVGIIMKIGIREYDVPLPYSDVRNSDMAIAEIFPKVISNSVSSILNVCGVIIFAASMSRLILGFIPADGWYTAALQGIFEFSSGISAIGELDIGEIEKIVLSVFIVGFAGISVHLQVISITARYGLSMKCYIIGKILHAVISSGIVYIVVRYTGILYKFVPEESARMSVGFMSTAVFMALGVAVLVFAGVILRRYFAGKKFYE